MKRLVAIMVPAVLLSCLAVYPFRHEAESTPRFARMNASELYESGRRFVDANPDSAVFYFDLAAECYRPESDAAESKACASALLAKGKLLYEHFSYSRAMETLLKCRRICEDRRMPSVMCEVLRYIGNIYSMHNDYDRAIDFYSRSYEVADSIKDPWLCHKVLSNLVGASIFSGNLRQADGYYAKMVGNKVDDIHYTYDILMDGGLLAMKKGDLREALRLLKSASEYVEKHKLETPKAGAPNSWIASIYEEKGESDSALHYLRINERLARESNQQDLLVETYHSFSEIYKRRGDRVNYLKYLEEYLTLSNELFNQSVFNSLKNTQFEYEMEKNERVIKDITRDREAKQASIRRMWIIIIVTVCALLVLTVLFIIITRQKRKLSEAYSDLYSRNLANLDNDKMYKQRIRELQSYIDTQQTEGADAGAKEENAMQAEAENPERTEEDNSSACDDDSAVSDSTTTYDIPASVRERLIRDISEYMDSSDNYCDPAFSIKTLADSIGSNTTYVSKVINETYGMNFRSYLSEYRIKESMRRLAKDSPYSGYTIKAIAESVGFKSQSAFITAFTRYTGMRPSIYQEMARKQ